MKTPRFVIASPAHNAGPYVEGSIKSALGQVYDQVRFLWLDDGSTDGSQDIARRVGRDRYEYFSNPTRMGAVYNYRFLSNLCDPDDVFVFLDADDQLAHPGVLRRLAALYMTGETWATYGQFRYDQVSGGGIGMACPIPSDNHTRKAGWRSTHLKTCLAGLLHLIPTRDLLTDKGEWLPSAGDLALFYPVIEMAGPAHARFIEEIMYTYNMQNPLNDCKVHAKEQKDWAAYIEALPVWLPLQSLPWRSL